MDNLQIDELRELRVLYLDDDVKMGKVMKAASEKLHIGLDYFESLTELGSVAFLKNYDLIITDYFMPAVKGGDVADYVTKLIGDVPVVILSANPHIERVQEKWPDSVKGFVAKNDRADRLLEEALSKAGLHQSMKIETKKNDHTRGSCDRVQGSRL